MQTVRIYFKKLGNAVYISHLDLVRCFTRAIRRSGIDVWYTQGFSNRPYLLFALPLALGIGSICEVVDIRLNEPLATRSIILELNRYLPEGIQIFECREAESKTAEIDAAAYLIELQDKPENMDLVEEITEKSIVLPEKIIIEKKSKHRITVTDIKQQIHSVSCVRKAPDRIEISVILDAGNNSNLNPVLITGKISETLDFSPLWEITRTAILKKDGSIY